MGADPLRWSDERFPSSEPPLPMGTRGEMRFDDRRVTSSAYRRQTRRRRAAEGAARTSVLAVAAIFRTADAGSRPA